MDIRVVIFWVVCLNCVAGLVTAFWRFRASARGWLAVYLLVLLICLVSKWQNSDAALYASGGLWVLFILLPGFMSLRFHRLLLQQRYAEGFRWARLIGLLHPADGWREQPEIVRALELGQRGELDRAIAILNRYQDTTSLGLTAMANLYRLTNRWEDFLDWVTRLPGKFDRRSEFLPLLLRAHGEVGDVRGLVELYDARKRQIANLTPPAQREFCRLMLFAFCGRRPAVEQLLGGALTVVPRPIQDFWLATADMAAGQVAARAQFEQLLIAADPPLRRAIERRLTQLAAPPPPPDASVDRVVEHALAERSQEERFGDRRGLFGKLARGTRLLLILNVLMFATELYLGGGTNPEALYRLGAMAPPEVRAGEWWRLVAATFLHYGAVHLTMNMLALALLGPFVEFALGLGRFLATYLFTGLASMFAVLVFARSEQITVGASGCVMGLVGATGALMLRGWLREKATVAKRRLIVIVAVIAVQSLFDALTPQVSMTAHLAGAAAGFGVALGLRNRLEAQDAVRLTAK